MRMSWITLPVMVVIAIVLLLTSGSGDVAKADPGPVQAGYDLLQTDSSGTYQDFSISPLPPDFFGPGCDPFAQKVFLKGVPFNTFGAFTGLSPTDTIVQRLQDAPVTFPNLVGATIDIEIVRLELVSVAPLTVTCPGGPQQWEMRAQVPEVGGPAQSQGSVTIRHEYPDGGTFDNVTLPVTPLLTFTEAAGPGVIGPFPGPTFELETVQPLPAPWCHTANPLDDPSGDAVVEVPGLTTNFFPGIICPDSPHNGVGQDGERTKRPIQDVEKAVQEFGHKVEPAENPSVGGTVELLAGGDGPDVRVAQDEGSGISASSYAVIAGGIAALAVTTAAGGWYARRRWLR